MVKSSGCDSSCGGGCDGKLTFESKVDNFCIDEPPHNTAIYTNEAVVV